ncbi:hypothetical protein DSM112329_01499 [Paraconexibacter sp. AEG42_29]|uniref:Phage head morphogenesis domain-containing protein n=1 Tax=Paraconexibacter sp. AEG42_29 TaxID=2997339 RepID=A0AAU7ASV2_9ACTN
MARWNQAFRGGLKAERSARTRITELGQRDPRAWAYLACEDDEESCDVCRGAAKELSHVPLRDPRLMILLRGHPDCTSAEGCRCSIIAVAGDEPGPPPRR